jgi:murein L,D-transpeptidase YcbB/YkuD
MKCKKYFVLITITLIILTAGLPLYAQSPINEEIEIQLNNFLECELNNLSIDSPCFLDELLVSYKENNYNPFWFRNGRLSHEAYELMDVIEKVDEEGLKHSFYRYNYLKNFLNKENLTFQEIARADIIMSNSFLLLNAHFTNGFLDPEEIEINWVNESAEIDIKEVLDNISNSGIKNYLHSLLPQSDNYSKLKENLIRYKKIKEGGGFNKLDSYKLLENGIEDPLVIQLKERLIQTDHYNGVINQVFDEELQKAVINFQSKHGLKEDGVVGPNTFKELNISIDERIKTIEINLERLRWLPQTLGERYVLVNIANYELDVYEENKKLFDMDVIVGQEQRSTPVFSDKIRYLALNPYWNVPRSIAVKDKLPLIKKDINYLKKNNYKVLIMNNGKLIEIDPETISWENLNRNNFNYYLRQEPGPNNALGQIKFMFPNKFSIYLHDTPSKELFSQTDRSFSSGCIRVENPFKLAEYILRVNNKWDPQQIEQILKTNKETIIGLSEYIPVHIVYFTSWVDENGLNFRKDIYNRDKRLIEAYNKII